MTSPAAGRADALDVLRGFALFGVLIVNIQFFAMPAAACFNPTACGDLEGVTSQVWLWTDPAAGRSGVHGGLQLRTYAPPTRV